MYTKQQLASYVKAHAMKNYAGDNGWDILVECYDDHDIIREIGDATEIKDAIANCQKVLDLLHEQRRSVQNEAF